MTSDTIKVGVLGCAKIVEFALVNPSKDIPELELYAIASRRSEKASEYAEKYGFNKALPSYDDVLADPEVDFVYIALPNDTHVAWALKAAEARKHILVEKPLAINTDKLYDLKERCEEKGVFLLEALMVQQHPWQSEIKKIVASNVFGALKEIQTVLTFIPKYDLATNYRGDPEKGGGCFYDLAPYWLQFIQSLRFLPEAQFDGESLFNGPNGIDTTFDASLTFNDGCRCLLETSFEKPYRAMHALYFDKATLTVNDIFRANTGRFKISCTIDNLQEKTKKKVFFPPSNYYENQLRFFVGVIRGCCSNIPFEQSMERIRLLSSIYNRAYEKSAAKNRNVSYPASGISTSRPFNHVVN